MGEFDETVTPEEVVDYVAERVVSYKQLAGGVEIVKEIPKSAAGKILRRNLLDSYKAKVADSSK